MCALGEGWRDGERESGGSLHLAWSLSWGWILWPRGHELSPDQKLDTKLSHPGTLSISGNFCFPFLREVLHFPFLGAFYLQFPCDSARALRLEPLG